MSQEFDDEIIVDDNDDETIIDDNDDDLLEDDFEPIDEPDEEPPTPVEGIIPSAFVKNRNDLVTFSLSGIDLTNATVEWTIHDKWLGDDESYYVPEIKKNGSVSDGPDLSDYFDRIIQDTGVSITTNIYYPGEVLVKAKITGVDFVTNFEYVYTPIISLSNSIFPSKMRIKYRALRCAPLLSTHKFAAFYKSNKNSIIASQLSIEEENNTVAKVVYGQDDAIVTRHTWKTAGVKMLTYKIFYDDGFRLRSSKIDLEFQIAKREVKDKDDPMIIRDNNYVHHSHHPQKVYVICTKRCFTEIGCSDPVHGFHETSILEQEED